MHSSNWKKINTLIEIPKHIHGTRGSGVFSFFFHDTEKECLLQTNKKWVFQMTKQIH